MTEFWAYLYNLWGQFTDLLFWKALIGTLLAITVGVENIQLFSVLIGVSFVDFLLAFFGYFFKKPKQFDNKKVVNWGIKIVVYWLIVSVFNHVSINISFVNYLTSTILYIYIFTEALSVIRNDISFQYTRAKYPTWLLERLGEYAEGKFKK